MEHLKYFYVYRFIDIRLQSTVLVKVLPRTVAALYSIDRLSMAKGSPFD